MENTPKIAEICDDEVKESIIIDIFKSFIRDGNKFVRLGTLELFGKFLIVLPKKCLNDFILDFYLSSVNHCYNKNNIIVQNSIDNDASYYCAYNFPAVLFCYGVEQWEVLKPTYFMLENDNSNENVQNSLACSLASLSNILKNDITEKDLMPVLDKFLILNQTTINYSLESLHIILRNVGINYRYKYLDGILKYAVRINCLYDIS